MRIAEWGETVQKVPDRPSQMEQEHYTDVQPEDHPGAQQEGEAQAALQIYKLLETLKSLVFQKDKRNTKKPDVVWKQGSWPKTRR